MYRKVIKDSKPFGAVEAKVVSVSCNGFIAVVQTVAEVVVGAAWFAITHAKIDRRWRVHRKLSEAAFRELHSEAPGN